MKHHSIEILAHQELTEADLGELRKLFDSEYLKEFGEWGSATALRLRVT